MTTAVLAPSRTAVVNLERDCLDADCAALAERFQAQLGVPKYSRGVSVMPVPESVEAWRAEHRTARKRADRAVRLGYTFAEIDRSQHNDAIHEINTSKQERQGRPMSDGYLTRHNHGPLPDYPCSRHCVHTYGVLKPATIPVSTSSSRRAGGRQGEVKSTLVAYLSLYRCGDLALVSMILGHGDHLANDIMYLLAGGTIAEHAGTGGFFYYNRHDSGTDGLRYYKERLGFFDGDVEWVLG